MVGEEARGGMSKDQGGGSLKKKLLGWVRGTLGKLEQALDDGPAAPAPMPGPAPGAAPGAPTRPRAPATAQLKNGTDQLSRTPAPEEPPAAPAPEQDPAAAAAESQKRMGFIVAYMKDPSSDPAFSDKQLVYKVLTEERSYQQQLVVALTEERRFLVPDDPRVAEIDAQMGTARQRQSQLFALLKRLTGVRGKTGGTGFISAPPEMPTLGEGPEAPRR